MHMQNQNVYKGGNLVNPVCTYSRFVSLYSQLHPMHVVFLLGNFNTVDLIEVGQHWQLK